MKLLTKTRNKYLVLLGISMLTFIIWQWAAEENYIKVLVNATNLTIGIIDKDTQISFEKEGEHKSQFMVRTRVNGKMGSYPQQAGGAFQPIVIILSWQLFLFFVLKLKPALKSAIVNIAIFFLLQMIFLIMLTNYYTSTIQQYIFDTMMDSFYVIALILIIKDNILYAVFRKEKSKIVS